ncbi:LysR substrate-binding domain-containing protein [Bosea sp. BIWAKO-01]|uniref:LysR substrate-binding domain-containing protein n=1 Tax=Bosea sp. BIWAKO-01 TaxID=506668 RepID=UPI0008536021|nr:LysR substrate-binding domain-containing protein [Bosea sp. BIWAKO-01]GAU86563.1 hypothetical protein BIWAKO_06511 [Bosea sp. BIWAKO-01]
MASPIDSELLKTFVTIVETQSFTRSGEHLRRTQPAISMQMKRLEEALGKTLFDRTSRGIRLTREGDILLHYARRILALDDEAQARIAQAGVQGIVRLGTSDDYATMLLPDILRRFAALQPGIQIEIACGNGDAMERKLGEGVLDLALVARPGAASDPDTIRTEELVWISSRQDLTRARPIPLAVFPEGCVCRSAMAEALHRSALDWRVVFSSDSIAAVHAAVRSGIAVTAVERNLVPGGVRIAERGDGLPALGQISLMLRTNPASTSPAVAALGAEIQRGLAVEGPLPAKLLRQASLAAAAGSVGRL